MEEGAMKLLLENWRRYITEEQGCPDEVVWHGSTHKIDGALEPRQAHDISGNPEQNLVAIYAYENREWAIIPGLVRKPDGSFPEAFINPTVSDQLVSINGEIRNGEKVYLYKLPAKTFRNTGVPDDRPEWVSEEEHGPVVPCAIEEVSVDDYTNLVRFATKEDIEFYKKHGGKVTEEDLEFLRSKGSDV
jgi:hypothetical protein